MAKGHALGMLVPSSVTPATWTVWGGVSASPGVPRRGWEGRSSEPGRGNDIGNRTEWGPWPVGPGWAAATAGELGSAGREGRLPQPQSTTVTAGP